MGYLEILFIAVIAFIIVGPRDFPKVMFFLGDTWRRLRMMASSFYDRIDEAAHEDDQISHKKKSKPRRP